MAAPLFQHRHYVAIANALADINEYYVPGLTDMQREHIAGVFIAHLRATNPKFDTERFLAAALGKPSNRRDA